MNAIGTIGTNCSHNRDRNYFAVASSHVFIKDDQTSDLVLR